MFYLLNKLIIVLIPIVPKFIVKIFANKYVAGVTTKEAFNVVRRLNKKNLHCTLDILGEHTSDLKQSIAISNKYQKIIQNIEEEDLDCNISIKSFPSLSLFANLCPSKSREYDSNASSNESELTWDF